MSDRLFEIKSIENIRGDGEVKSNSKFIGSILLIGTGVLAADVALRPLIGESVGALPALRFAIGALGFATGCVALSRLERYPSEEQLHEYYTPQLPLE